LGDSDETQDIVSQVFIKLYNGLKDKLSFEKEQRLKAFLYITTRNQCLSHLRDIKKINSGNTGLRVLTDPFDPAIDERLIWSELMAEIHNEIKKLPDRQGEIFMMANFAGLNNAEIAKLLNISVSTVKTANQKALQKLKAVFAKKPIFLLLLFSICSN
jgi:RNA polymerase sigma-70 factor (ECF subfamily)